MEVVMESGVIVVIKSMAIDGHLQLKWINVIRQKPELSTQTKLTTSTLYRR